MRHLPSILALGLSLASIPACMSTGAEEEDGMNDSVGGGKADGVEPGSREAFAILRAANELTLAQLREDVGLSTRAANNIVTYRASDDGVLGTDDDLEIEDLDELDGIPYIGPVAFEKLLAYAEAQGWAAPAKLILFYDFGNATAGSQVQISDDGTAERIERLTETDFDSIPDHLDREIIREIQLQIAEVMTDSVEVRDGAPTTPDGEYGQLVVYDADGREIVLDRVEPVSVVVGLDQHVRNTSAAAERLRGSILGLVDHDLPQ